MGSMRVRMRMRVGKRDGGAEEEERKEEKAKEVV